MVKERQWAATERQWAHECTGSGRRTLDRRCSPGSPWKGRCRGSAAVSSPGAPCCSCTCEAVDGERKAVKGDGKVVRFQKKAVKGNGKADDLLRYNLLPQALPDPAQDNPDLRAGRLPALSRFESVPPPHVVLAVEVRARPPGAGRVLAHRILAGLRADVRVRIFRVRPPGPAVLPAVVQHRDVAVSAIAPALSATWPAERNQRLFAPFGTQRQAEQRKLCRTTHFMIFRGSRLCSATCLPMNWASTPLRQGAAVHASSQTAATRRGRGSIGSIAGTHRATTKNRRHTGIRNTAVSS